GPPGAARLDGGDPPRRLVEQTVANDAAAPKALAGSGRLVRRAQPDEAVWRRFVEGRPVRALTPPLLDWCGGRLEARGVRVWGLIGDNAPWQVSQAVRAWLRAHNRAVKQQGGGEAVPWGTRKPRCVGTARLLLTAARWSAAPPDGTTPHLALAG